MKFVELLAGLKRAPLFVVLERDASGPAFNARMAIGLGVNVPASAGDLRIPLVKSPDHASLSMVASAEGAQLRARPEFEGLRDREVAGLVSGLAFVVKDASPDTLLTALLVLTGIAGVSDAGTRLDPWLEAITRWDQGLMPNRPFKSWPALASTAAHAGFPDMLTSSTETESGSAFVKVWERCFLFLVQSIERGDDPARMPRDLQGVGRHAVTALRRAQQLYVQTLAHATVLQLSVPLRDASDRRIAVDALLYTEDEPSDAIKLFARTDSTAPASQRGYKLGVSFRPNAEPWNRYTIHTDPGEGLDLTLLWETLERLETRAWQDPATGTIGRKADREAPAGADFEAGTLPFLPVGPKGAASFSAADLARLGDKTGRARVLGGVNNVWSNPWYLTPNGSLIASPGRDGGRNPAEPTRLGWQDVIDALWSTFQPLAGVRVQAHLSPARPEERVEVELMSAPAFALADRPEAPLCRFLAWPRSRDTAVKARAIVLDDFNLRLLGALAGSTGAAGIGPNDLPPLSACRRVDLSGGFAVLSFAGCVIVDDWRHQALDAPRLFEAAQRAAGWKLDLDDHGKRLAEFTARVAKADPNVGPEKAAYTLLGDLAIARSELSTRRIAASPAAFADPNARVLYEACCGIWSVARLEAHVDQGYEQIERSVKSLQDSRSARLLRYLGIYGFPAFIATNFSKPIADVTNAMVLSYTNFRLPALLQLPESAPAIAAYLLVGEAVSWLLCTLALGLLLNRLYKKWDPTVRKRSDDH